MHDEARLRHAVFGCFKPSTIMLYHNDVDGILAGSWDYFLNGLIYLSRSPRRGETLTLTAWVKDYQDTLVITTLSTLTHLIPTPDLELMSRQAAMTAMQGVSTLLYDHPDVIQFHPERRHPNHV